MAIHNVLTAKKHTRWSTFFNKRGKFVLGSPVLWLSWLLFRRRYKKNTLEILTALHDSLSAKFDFLTSVRTATQYARFRYVRHVGRDIIQALQEGTAIVLVIRRFPQVFSKDFVQLMQQSDAVSIAETLSHYVAVRQFLASSKQTSFLSLLTPLLSLIIVIIASIIVSVKLFSMYVPLFVHLRWDVSSYVILFYKIFRVDVWVSIVSTIAMVFLGYFLLSVSRRYFQAFNKLISRLLLFVPFFRNFALMNNSLLFIGGLSLACRLKKRPPESFYLAKSFIHNPVLRDYCHNALVHLSAYGVPGIEPLLERFLPPEDAHLLALAMQLDNLEDATHRINTYRAHRFRFLQTMVTQTFRAILSITSVVLLVWLLITGSELFNLLLALPR